MIPPRPWHLLLAPALPILALLSGDSGVVLPESALWPLAVACTTALLCWAGLAWMVGNARTSALVVSIISLIALSQSTVAQVARALGTPRLLPLITLGVLVVCGVILSRGGRAAGLTMFANALMISSVLLVTAPVIGKQFQKWWSPTLRLSAVELPPDGTVQHPDIYVLVLDGYGRADVLRDHFSFENPLPADLKSMGFTVAEKATSNYAQTAQSLASALNLEYLPALLNDGDSRVAARHRFADLISRNRTFLTLAAAGYRIRSYASEYAPIDPEDVDERPRPFLYWTDFEYGLYGNSIFPLLSTVTGFPVGAFPAAVHRRHVRWMLDHLEREVPGKNDPPTFVFAHLLIPHPPFSFEADGAPLQTGLPATLNDGSHWHAQAMNSGETYADGYVKSVQFLNARLVEIVRSISSRQRDRPAIFYLQADHGPGSRLDWEDSVQTDVRERMGILLAARFPDGFQQPVYAHITPVNGFRLLLNAALGTTLPLLDDRAFFSPWRQPLAFIDVTERIADSDYPPSVAVSATGGAR